MAAAKYLMRNFDRFNFSCFLKQALSSLLRIVSTLSKSKVDFIPSVGPGYDDTSIRPWNKQNSRSRADGEYYSKYWNEAIKLKPKIISITSFNEWHEESPLELFQAIYDVSNTIQ